MITSLLLCSVALDTQGFDSHRLAEIPVCMNQFVRANELAGVVTLVRRGGKTVLFGAQGNATLDPVRPMTKDTVFQVMSMTKPVTAAAVMVCAERGLLSLDDRIDRFIPSFGTFMVKQADGSTRKARRPITIRHLLTHTSGLSGNDPGGLDDNQKIQLTLAHYADRYGKDALESEPGTEIRYSGPGITAAGRVVEIVTGLRFEDFVQREIFDRLGMRDTSFFATPSLAARLARVYWFEDERMQTLSDDPTRRGSKFANPAGGLYSTADDMATFIQSFVDKRNKLLSPRSIQAMTTLQTGTLLSDGSDAQGYGLGFAVVRSPAGGPTLRPEGSFGHTGAYGTEFWADPKTGMVVVYLSQTFNERPRKIFNTMVNAAFVGP